MASITLIVIVRSPWRWGGNWTLTPTLPGLRCNEWGRAYGLICCCYMVWVGEAALDNKSLINMNTCISDLVWRFWKEPVFRRKEWFTSKLKFFLNKKTIWKEVLPSRYISWWFRQWSGAVVWDKNLFPTWLVSPSGPAPWRRAPETTNRYYSTRPHMPGSAG